MMMMMVQAIGKCCIADVAMLMINFYRAAEGRIIVVWRVSVAITLKHF